MGVIRAARRIGSLVEQALPRHRREEWLTTHRNRSQRPSRSMLAHGSRRPFTRLTETFGVKQQLQ